jgi:hypothetical protein
VRARRSPFWTTVPFEEGLADAVRGGLRERARQADGTYVPLQQSEAKD